MPKKDKTPLRVGVPSLEKAREDFLSEAGKKGSVKSDVLEDGGGGRPLPWEEPEVSERVLKAFNIRLSEPDYLRLKFVASQSPDKSTHAFCVRLIMQEVHRRLYEMK